MGNSSSKKGRCIVSANKVTSGSPGYERIHQIKTWTTKASCDNYQNKLDDIYGGQKGVFTAQYFRN